MTLAVPKPRRKSAFTLALEARWDAVECTHRCDCGYSVTGPTGTAREQMRAHRISKHPERPAVAKRPKKPKAPRYEQNAEDRKILHDLAKRQNGGPKKNSGQFQPGGYRVSLAQLEELYVKQGLLIREVAAQLGVDPNTISRALDRHGVPRHPYKRYNPRSYITVEREAAAWTLYEQGFTAHEIASVAWELWGYSTLLQCRRSMYDAFARTGRQTRRPERRLKSELRTFDPVAALAILKEAE